MHKAGNIIIRPVANKDELKAIFQLRYEHYLRKEYIPPYPDKMLRDEWDNIPETMHFVGLDGHKIIGAVRLVLDSPKGLPMERVFSEDISLLRNQNSKLAEASTLVAVDGGCDSERRLWLDLCRAVWLEAENRNIDDLCITVTQNHLGFYERLLFEIIGEAKNYRFLNGIIAYPLSLQVSKARVKDKSQGKFNDQSLRNHFLNFPEKNG